jgi:hypothetical protein
MKRFASVCARRRARRGIAVVYVALAVFALFGLVSWGVEVGRVSTAKAQLATAADGAALAAVPLIATADFDGATEIGVEVGEANQCEGTAISMISGEDVEFGVFRLNTHTYTAEGATEPNGNAVTLHECNAVKVYARRVAARNNALNLFFARVFGHNTHNVVATAVAFVRGGTHGAGIVGLNWINMTGTTEVDSYSHEPYDPAHHNSNAQIASNGDITVVGTVDIYGDAHPGVDHSFNSTSNTTITGWASPLEAPLAFPPVTVPAGVTSSGQLKLNGNQTRTLAPGTYWFTSIKMSGNATLIIQPQVKLYCTGDIDMTGGSVTNSGTPAGFALYSVGAHQVDLGGGSTLKAHVYAPQSDVRMLGTGSGAFGFYGWVIGNTLDITGNTQVHYDETLESGASPIRTMLVK